jgi:hypothetical protein
MRRTCTPEGSERLSRVHPKLRGHITKAGADRVDAKDGMAVDDGMRAGQLYAESHASLFCSRYQYCGGLLKQVDGRGPQFSEECHWWNHTLPCGAEPFAGLVPHTRVKKPAGDRRMIGGVRQDIRIRNDKLLIPVQSRDRCNPPRSICFP